MKLVSVIYLTTQLNKKQAREYAETNPGMNVIERKYPYKDGRVRTKYIFVQVVPEGSICLLSTRKVESDLIKQVWNEKQKV